MATNILESSFHSKFGGLQVLCAPSGSGKTTYLRKYANEFIRRGGHVQYYASELKSSNDFFASFGDEDRSQDLFSKLPLNSAIIIDQFDRCGDTVNKDLSRLLRHLALESRRTVGNIVIVSTSSLGNAETVLRLNGNNKINLAGPPLWFKWTEDMTNTYIDKAFPHWCESDRLALRSYALVAQSPGFLYLVSEIFPLGPGSSHMEVVSDMAQRYKQVWGEFEEFQKEWRSFTLKR